MTNREHVELERDESGEHEGQVWHDVDFRHVIVEETEDTARIDGPGPGFYVRDEDGESGPHATLTGALAAAERMWGEVTLAPANRLVVELADGRADEVGEFLLQYLAEYGTTGIDAQALAQRVFERIEED